MQIFRYPRCLAVILLMVKAAFGLTPAVLDPAGNIWHTGRVINSLSCGLYVVPPGFPVNIPCGDATVTKLDPTGTQILFTTTFGGHGDSGGLAITADSAGNIYVAGYTCAPDFPVTSGALQTTNAGPYSIPANGGSTYPGGDAFIVKLNPNGSVAYATFLGGSGNDFPVAISVDSTGSVYVAGCTASTDFPLTSPPLSSTPGAGFVVKINPGGQSLNFSTYFSFAISASAVDSAGAVYLTGFTGNNIFAAKIDTSGSALAYSTLLGSSDSLDDSALAIAVDSQGAAWIGGETYSAGLNLSGTTGTGGAFLLKLSPDGSTIQTGSRFGPPNAASLTTFVALDARDNVYASGELSLFQSAFSPSASGFQPTSNAQLSIPCASSGGNFLVELASGGTPLYASFLRRLGTILVTAPSHLLIDSAGGALALDLTSTPAMNFQCPVNSASYSVPAAPGEIVSLFGYGLGPEAGVAGQPDASGRFPTSLAGVQVQFNGLPAPLLYVQSGQINTVVPNEPMNDGYTVEVTYQGQSAPLLDVAGNPVNPGVFAVVNEDSTVNSPAHPAEPGSIISVYATGMDMFDVDFPDGQVVPISPLLPFNFSLNGDSVTFAGIPGTTLWEGAAPGFIFGLDQINVQLPASLPPASSVPMVVVSSYTFSSPTFPLFVAP